MNEDCERAPAERTVMLAFSEFWKRRWPNTTENEKTLDLSAHYRGCREAFAAGYDAAQTRKA